MIRTRFAPSPTGRLHLGNARTALYAYLLARANGGTFILRVEDTDAARSRPEFERSIIDDLEWLGIIADESPDHPGACGPYRQSERVERHRAAVQELLDADRAYPCFCTADELELARREAIAAHRAPRYSGRCRERTAAERDALTAADARPAIRFRSPHRDIVVRDLLRGDVHFRGDDLDDVIIARSDGAVSFLLASVLDDADMGVTHVLRGDDHLSNTPRQILLLEALGRRAPDYGHLGLIHGEQGRPLSKREGGFTVAELRESGFHPHAVVAALARLGWAPPEDFASDPIGVYAKTFRVEDLSSAPCAWDDARLAHENARTLRHLSADELIALMGDEKSEDANLRAAVELLRPEIHSIGDLKAKLAIFRPDEVPYEADAKSLFGDSESATVVATFLEILEKDFDLTLDRFQSALKMTTERTGRKGKGLYMPIRVAITGRAHGPELAPTALILGLEQVRYRLRQFLSGAK